MGKTKLIFFATFLCCTVYSCPPPEDIAPFCKCDTGSGGDNVMYCDDLLSPDQLVNPIRAISMHKVKLFSLTIEKSSLMYIPDDIFKDTFIKEIRFVDTELMSLSDSDVAFRGLENTLTEIRATAANYIAQWDWKQLENLKHLNLIDVNWISLGSIYEPFPNLPRLTALGIIRAEISFIVDFAFENLPNLQILNMQKNSISKLKRNMFPDPAEKLSIFDVSDNKLSYLPDDFFNNMPSLNLVHLDRNKFVTLSETAFLQALKTTQDFSMAGNPFRCDCRMRWIVSAPLRYGFNAVCSSPEVLAGKQIKHLDLKELWC